MGIIAHIRSLTKPHHDSERAFIKETLKFSGLSAVGKVVTVLTLPLLSRLYDPGAFGLLSGFIAMLGFVGCIGAFKIEYTIALPRTMRKARYLLAAALVVSCVIVAFLALFALYLWPRIAADHTSLTLRLSFLFSSIGILIFTIFRQWLTRCERYMSIGFSYLHQSIIQAFVRVTLPALSPALGVHGLPIGDTAGRLWIAALLWRRSMTFPILRYMAAYPVWLRILRPYWRHCVGHTAASILSELPGVIFPLSVIYFYRETQAGYVGMAYTSIQAVANVLILAITQVFFGNITQLYHTEPALVHGRFIRLINQLALMMIPGGILVLGWGPEIFSYVLGKGWEQAGIYCQILLPAFVAQLMVSPTINLLVLTRRVRRQLRVNACWMTLTTLLIVYNHYRMMDIVSYLTLISIIYSVAYVWLGMEVFMATRRIKRS